MKKNHFSSAPRVSITMPNSMFIGGDDKHKLRATLAENEIQLNAYAEVLFHDAAFDTYSQSRQVFIVKSRVRDLGLSGGATTREIHKKADKFGFSVCPLELGPHLRLQYNNQPVGKRLIIASEKLHTDPNFPNGFYIESREDGLWLRGYCASSTYVWKPDEFFIFLAEPPIHE